MERRNADRALENVFIHIGFHKCGSTAINRGLTKLAARLRAEGVFFPLGEHALIASLFAGSRGDFFHNEAHARTDRPRAASEDRAYLDEVRSEAVASGCHTLVLSYEGFPNLTDAEVAHLVGSFAAMARRVVVVCYCRHPISFAPSEISQRARSGVSTAVISPFPPILAFKDALPKFVRAAGRDNVIVRDFDRRRLAGGDVLRDFLSLLPDGERLAAEAPGQRSDVNRALSQEALAIAVALRALYDPGQPMDRFAGHPRIQGFLDALGGAKIVLSEEEQSFLRERSAEHLQYLHDTFGLVLLEPQPDPENATPRPFGDAFVESLARAVKPLMGD